MKTLYFECNMGVAGDMLMAALLELHDNPTEFLERLNAVGIPDVVVTSNPSVKHGITGSHIKVVIDGREENSRMHVHDHKEREYSHTLDTKHHEHHEHGHGHTHDHKHHEHRHAHRHEHKHNSYQDIEHLIGNLNISDNVKKNSLAVYKLIAEAESRAHGVPVTQIHFHEVGKMDAVADIVGVCMLIEELAPDKIFASPINVGSGHVRCAHGILPVPAPATIHVLRGVPIYSDNIKGELCTPTGAALLKHFVTKFDKMPRINVARIGYGMGTKDFERANCLRSYLGNTGDNDNRDEVTELVCNLDDMTPEAVAFAQQLLLDTGALDVYITPIVMKKNRAGVMFTCMCYNDVKEKMISLIFKHTTTLGIREIVSRRYTLQRDRKIIQTKYGAVEVKTAHGWGVTKSKLEYDDVAGIARDNHISIQEVLKEA